MWLLRPAQAHDLEGILQLVRRRGRGLSSTVPREADALAERIARSEIELAGGRPERILFVLEGKGRNDKERRVWGVSGIDTRAGNGEPFYNYRRDWLIHASRELGISRRVEVLFPSHGITDRTLLCGFAIETELQDTAPFELLSRARLLFIAEHRRHFADDIAVEIQGLQPPDGEPPFWTSLGGHFFNTDFKTADRYSASLSKTFIAELMPSSPIYVSLLSDEAQRAIGRAHDASASACRLFAREGFAAGTYVDIFDAGPVLEARTDQLATLRKACTKTLDSEVDESGQLHLLSAGQGSGFRATLGPVSWLDDHRLRTSASVRALLNCRAGEPLRVAALMEAATC